MTPLVWLLSEAVRIDSTKSAASYAGRGHPLVAGSNVTVHVSRVVEVDKGAAIDFVTWHNVGGPQNVVNGQGSVTYLGPGE